MSIYKTPSAQAELITWHERFKARLGRPTESRQLTTKFGPTHCLVCGPESAPPLVLLHGALASSAHALGEVVALTDHYRIYALDVIGQSPLSAPSRPEVNSLAYGEWLQSCLDALELPSARLLGVSWGGFIALRLAALAPERIEKLSLVVPAGLVQNNSPEAFFKVGFPMLLYTAFPSPKRLERAVTHLFTSPDPEWRDYLGVALRGIKLDFRPPRPLHEGELAYFTAPVQVIAAEHDLSFPGTALLARAKTVFPNLAATELLANTRHTPAFTAEARQQLTRTIAAFLAS